MGLDRIVPANGVAAVVRWWDEHVPIGSRVRCGDSWFTTWSHAGRGRRGAPVVFVAEREEPVPLSAIREFVVGDLVYRR